MAILRTGNNGERNVVEDVKERHERHIGDFDLGWDSYLVYVLDKHEWFDPHTSTKYSENGLSRHACLGPAVVVVHKTGVGFAMNTSDYHVNDPAAWAWIRRSIAQGSLDASSISDDGCNDEADVTTIGDVTPINSP